MLTFSSNAYSHIVGYEVGKGGNLLTSHNNVNSITSTEPGQTRGPVIGGSITRDAYDVRLLSVKHPFIHYGNNLYLTREVGSTVALYIGEADGDS